MSIAIFVLRGVPHKQLSNARCGSGDSGKAKEYDVEEFTAKNGEITDNFRAKQERKVEKANMFPQKANCFLAKANMFMLKANCFLVKADMF